MELCMNYVYVAVLYMVVNLPNVCGEIGVNCGPGAVTGQPYNLECTDIPAAPTNGINVFLEGESNSIIFCFIPSKTCGSQNSSLYSVSSPHNESLYFTILSVTADDIGKKLYCVDDTTLESSTPKPSCTIIILQSTTTDYQPNPEIGVNCGPGAVVGQPYNLECTNIPTTVTNGINVFLGDPRNSIINCFHSKNCTTKKDKLYSVVSPHTTSLSFTIKNVTTDNIGKKLYCVDKATLDLSTPKPSCTIIGSDDGLSDGEIAAIVAPCIIIVLVVFIVIILWQKRVACFS